MTLARWQEGARRVLEQVSPSQIENFERCARVWFFGSILRVPRTTKASQARGSAIHKEAEHFLETGKIRPAWFSFDEDAQKATVVNDASHPAEEGWQDLRPMVEALVPHLPDRTLPTTSVEQWVPRFSFWEGGPMINGRYDAWENTRPRATLHDVKSRSDFRYCKSPAELADDVQLTSYALPLAYADQRDMPTEVTLRHLYTKTKGRAKARPVEVVVTIDELKARWRKTAETVKKMAEWAAWAAGQTSEPGIERVPPNTSACNDYGGCEHRRRCGFDADGEPGVRRSMTTTKREEGAIVNSEDVLAKMRANIEKMQPKPAASPAVPQAARPAIPEGAAAPQPPSRPALPEGASATPQNGGPRVATTNNGGQIWHKGEAGGFIMKPPASEEERAAVAAKVVDNNVAEAVLKFRSGVLKVDPTDQSSVWAGTSRLLNEQLTPEVRRARDIYLSEVRAVRPPDAGAPVDPPALPAAAVAEAIQESAQAKKPRASKKGPDIAELGRLEEELHNTRANLDKALEYGSGAMARIQQLEEALANADAQLAQARHDQARTVVIEQHRDVALPPGALPEFVLYVDCLPTKGEHVMDFEEWLAPITAMVAQAKGVADWRMIDYTAEGDLVAAITTVVSQGNVLPRQMRVCGSSRARAAVLEVLVPRATQVIRGLAR